MPANAAGGAMVGCDATHAGHESSRAPAEPERHVCTAANSGAAATDPSYAQRQYSLF